MVLGVTELPKAKAVGEVVKPEPTVSAPEVQLPFSAPLTVGIVPTVLCGAALKVPDTIFSRSRKATEEEDVAEPVTLQASTPATVTLNELAVAPVATFTC